MNEIEDLKQLEELKKVILKKILSKQAFERLARIKLVKPELAAQLELYLLQLYQQNKIKEEISDEQLKAILERLTSKREFKIIK
ncbi:MAG: DNA-binding protein [Candidatus Aenigmatarchaeota archaeon]